MPVYSINSWSLERSLGPLRMIEWREEKKEHALKVEQRPETYTLRELLGLMGEKGYSALELSYAQIQDSSDEALESLRTAAREAGVRLVSLLLDYGDLSSVDPVRRRADTVWYSRWIEIAAKAGFCRVRIPGGEADPNDRAALQRAAEGLSSVAQYASPLGIRVVTENLGSLLSHSANCLHLLDLCRGSVGITADFGNFKTDKYRQLAEVIAVADTVHAKAEALPDGRFDEADFIRCIELCSDTGFKGPYSLTYLGDAVDVWQVLAAMRGKAEAALNRSMLSGYHGR